MDKLPLPGFQDGKSPDALRTIGEVAKAFNLRQHVLRYWEEQFPMLQPLTRAGGRRYYRPEDIALIAEISRLLYQEGFTIRGARQALSGWPKASAVTASPEADALPLGSDAGGNTAGREVEPAAQQLAGQSGGVVVDARVIERLVALRHQLARALEI